jgi:hypothetical protein
VPIVEEFMLDCSRYGRGSFCGGEMGHGEKIVVLAVVQNRDDGSRAAGWCRKRNRWDERSSWAIEIDASVIEDDGLAKSILYHELGHCVLGLDHDTMGENPIMSPNGVGFGTAEDEANLLSLFTRG